MTGQGAGAVGASAGRVQEECRENAGRMREPVPSLHSLSGIREPEGSAQLARSLCRARVSRCSHALGASKFRPRPTSGTAPACTCP